MATITSFFIEYFLQMFDLLFVIITFHLLCGFRFVHKSTVYQWPDNFILRDWQPPPKIVQHVSIARPYIPFRSWQVIPVCFLITFRYMCYVYVCLEHSGLTRLHPCRNRHALRPHIVTNHNTVSIYYVLCTFTISILCIKYVYYCFLDKDGTHWVYYYQWQQQEPTPSDIHQKRTYRWTDSHCLKFFLMF